MHHNREKGRWHDITTVIANHRIARAAEVKRSAACLARLEWTELKYRVQ